MSPMQPRSDKSDSAHARAYAAERAVILRAFSANVRTARTATPYSQESLARVARIHRTEVSQLERAVAEPRLLTILVIAGALNVGAASLLDGLPVPVERRSPNYPKRGR
jgi:transcriptional regulator with XRE-family HTH domain